MQDEHRIPRQSVASSNLSAVGYSEPTQELDIEFHNGSIWRYYDVPAETHQEFVNAGSIGQFYNRKIKGSFSGKPLDRSTGEPFRLVPL